MVACKNGPGEIVEIASTGITTVPLTMRLCLIQSMLDDVLAAAKRTSHTLRPAQFANFSITTRVVDEVLDVDQSHADSILSYHVFLLQAILPRRTYGIVPLMSSAPYARPS